MRLHAATAMNNVVRQYLCQVVRNSSAGALLDRRRLAAALTERCGTQPQECTALLLALNNDAVDALASRHGTEPWPALLDDLGRRLAQTTGLDEQAARWAVESWRGALLAAGILAAPSRRSVSQPTLDDIPAPPAGAAIYALPTGKLAQNEPEPTKTQAGILLPQELPAANRPTVLGIPEPAAPVTPFATVMGVPLPPVGIEHALVTAPSEERPAPPRIDAPALVTVAAVPLPKLTRPAVEPAPVLWEPQSSPPAALEPVPLRRPRSRNRALVMVIVGVAVVNVALVGGALAWKKVREHRATTPTAVEAPGSQGDDDKRKAEEEQQRSRADAEQRLRREKEEAERQRQAAEEQRRAETQAQVKKHVQAGTRHRNAREHDRALEEYQKALDLDAGCVDALVGRGMVFNEIRKYPQALGELNAALKIDPSHKDGLIERGRVYLRLTRYDEAIADCSAVLQRDPRNAAALNNRGLCWTRKNELRKALDDYNACLEIQPTSARAWANRGEVYYRMHEYTRALEDLTQSLRYDNTLDYVYSLRGRVYYSRREYEKSVAEFTNALRLSPRSAYYRASRALAYLALDQLPKVLEDCNEAIAIDASSGDAYAYRAEYHRRNKDLDRALADAEQAVTLQPKDTWGFFVRGLVRKDQGRAEQAIADFRKALDLDPTHEGPRAHLANLTNRGLIRYLPEDTELFFALCPPYLPDDPRARKDAFEFFRGLVLPEPHLSFFQSLGIDLERDIEQYLLADYREGGNVNKLTVVARGKLPADVLSRLAGQGKLVDRSVNDVLAGKCQIYEWSVPGQGNRKTYCGLVTPEVLVYSWSRDAVREAFHRERVQGRSSLNHRPLQRLLDGLDGRCGLWCAGSGTAIQAIPDIDREATRGLEAATARLELRLGLKLDMVLQARSAAEATALADRCRELRERWQGDIRPDVRATPAGKALVELLRSGGTRVDGSTTLVTANLGRVETALLLGVFAAQQRQPKK